MRTFVNIAPNKDGTAFESSTAFRYQGAKFFVEGHLAFENAMKIIESLPLQKFQMQCVEITSYYADLHSDDFKYLRLSDGVFEGIESVQYSCNDDQQKTFVNRMTVKKRKHSDLISYLLVVRPMCLAAECSEHHGEMQILVVGKQHFLLVDQLIDLLLKKKDVEGTILNDAVKQYAGTVVNYIAGLGGDYDVDVMSMLLKAGALK